MTTVDIKKLVKNLTGQELECDTESIKVSKDTYLYRFGDDEVHVLVDGAGGYTLIQEPCSDNPIKTTGHFSESSIIKTISIVIVDNETINKIIGQAGTLYMKVATDYEGNEDSYLYFGMKRKYEIKFSPKHSNDIPLPVLIVEHEAIVKVFEKHYSNDMLLKLDGKEIHDLSNFESVSYLLSAEIQNDKSVIYPIDIAKDVIDDGSDVVIEALINAGYEFNVTDNVLAYSTKESVVAFPKKLVIKAMSSIRAELLLTFKELYLAEKEIHSTDDLMNDITVEVMKTLDSNSERYFYDLSDFIQSELIEKITSEEAEVLEIRFLRQGLIKAPKPEGFDDMSAEEQEKWANSIIESKSDLEILEAMSDLPNATQTGKYFEGTVHVAAIESKEGEELLYSTDEWEAFAECDSTLTIAHFSNADKYCVYAICESHMEKIYFNLSKSEAKKNYVELCHSWYNADTLGEYASENETNVSDMDAEDFDDFASSDIYSNSNDLGVVEVAMVKM